MHRHRRSAPSLTVVVALTLLLGACGGSDGGAPAAAPSSPTAAATTTDPGSPSASATDQAPSRDRGRGPYASYVALGDSYTAAPGVPQTDPADGCLRSTGNYPHLVAAALKGPALDDVSCSGADSTSLVGVQKTADGVLHPAQFDALSRRTDLVTIGMGGNDEALFTTLIGGCASAARQDPEGAPCTRSVGPQARRALATIRTRLVAVFQGVRDRAPNATVVAVGYPQIIPARGTCQQLLPLAVGDYPFARTINRGLDAAVRAAASKAGVRFADVWSATAGHDICAQDPWINGAANRPGEAIPFHPFAAEQQAAARAVLAALGR